MFAEFPAAGAAHADNIHVVSDFNKVNFPAGFVEEILQKCIDACFYNILLILRFSRYRVRSIRKKVLCLKMAVLFEIVQI